MVPARLNEIFIGYQAVPAALFKLVSGEPGCHSRSHAIHGSIVDLGLPPGVHTDPVGDAHALQGDVLPVIDRIGIEGAFLHPGDPLLQDHIVDPVRDMDLPLISHGYPHFAFQEL